MTAVNDATLANWSLASIPDGTYTLKVWYRTGWLEGVSESITIDDEKAKKDGTEHPLITPEVWTRYCDLLDKHPVLKTAYTNEFLDRSIKMTK